MLQRLSLNVGGQTVLTGPDPSNGSMHKTMHPTHEQPGYGDAHYASPTKSGTKAISQSYEASKRFSAQGESGRCASLSSMNMPRE